MVIGCYEFAHLSSMTGISASACDGELKQSRHERLSVGCGYVVDQKNGGPGDILACMAECCRLDMPQALCSKLAKVFCTGSCNVPQHAHISPLDPRGICARGARPLLLHTRNIDVPPSAFAYDLVLASSAGCKQYRHPNLQFQGRINAEVAERSRRNPMSTCLVRSLRGLLVHEGTKPSTSGILDRLISSKGVLSGWLCQSSSHTLAPAHSRPFSGAAAGRSSLCTPVPPSCSLWDVGSNQVHGSVLYSKKSLEEPVLCLQGRPLSQVLLKTALRTLSI